MATHPVGTVWLPLIVGHLALYGYPCPHLVVRRLLTDSEYLSGNGCPLHKRFHSLAISAEACMLWVSAKAIWLAYSFSQ